MTEYEQAVLDALSIVKQAVMAAAWAVGFVAGSFSWRLVVLAKNQRRFWAVLLAVTAVGAAEGRAGDPPRIVQQSPLQTAAGSVTVAGVAEGSRLVVVWSKWAGSGTTDVTVSGAGVSWTLAAERMYSTGSKHVRIFYSAPVAAGDHSVTVTEAGGSAFRQWQALEVAGVYTGNPVVQTGTFENVGGVTTHYATDEAGLVVGPPSLAIAVASTSGTGSQDATASQGWTELGFTGASVAAWNGAMSRNGQRPEFYTPGGQYSVAVTVAFQGPSDPPPQAPSGEIVTGTLSEFQLAPCGANLDYGEQAIAVLVTLNGPNGQYSAYRFRGIPLPSPEMRVEFHTGNGLPFDLAICDYIGHFTANPPPAGSPEADLLKFLRLYRCGELEAAFVGLHSSPECGSLNLSTFTEYLPEPNCVDCVGYPPSNVDTDGDGIPDHSDPEPENPDICGDHDGDGDDDCAECADGSCDWCGSCERCADGSCAWTWEGDHTGFVRCGECPCVDDPATSEDECACVDNPLTPEDECCEDDPETPEDECGCVDDPETPEDECDRVKLPGCECSIDLKAMRERLEGIFATVGLPLPRVFPEVPDFAIAIELPIVDLATGTTVQEINMNLTHNFAGLGEAGAVLDGFRVAFRDILIAVMAVLLTFRGLRALNYGG